MAAIWPSRFYGCATVQVLWLLGYDPVSKVTMVPSRFYGLYGAVKVPWLLRCCQGSMVSMVLSRVYGCYGAVQVPWFLWCCPESLEGIHVSNTEIETDTSPVQAGF